MDAANKCEKHSVSPSDIFSNINLAKCMIDVMVFKNMEKIVDRMQDSVNGVPLRRDITLEYAHPSVFTGADLVNWILYNTEIATTENALYMANLLFSNGLFFSITRHQMMVTNDEHCYRFQRVFKKNTSDEHKKIHPTYHESFFRQPRYQIGYNRFEFPDILTYRQEKNQPIGSLANSPSSMIFEEPCIQTNNSNNTKNNNNNIINNHFSTNDEHQVSVGGSRVAENEQFEQMLIDKPRKMGGPNNLDCTAPNYWISNIPQPGDYEYAVYLCKKHMEVKNLSGMADYEIERLEYFKKIYCNKWVHINLQAETTIKIVDKKNDLYEKKLINTQEQAFWDFHRPMPQCISLKAPLDYKKLLMFKELTDWDEDKIIDTYIQNTNNL